MDKSVPRPRDTPFAMADHLDFWRHRSWFARTSFSRLSDRSTHELPQWRSPSPMLASMIPPPIVQAKPQSRSPVLQAKSVVLQKSTLPDNQEQELQADLQYLLDAQAEGLLRGLEGGSTHHGMSTGSTTPTNQNRQRGSSSRPTRRKPGLRSARKGLYNTMVALSAVKEDELFAVQTQLDETDTHMKRIEEWSDKRERLQEACKTVAADDETAHIQQMTQEAETLAHGINTIEHRLSQMKAKHRKLLSQISAAESAAQARLASYTTSLRLLEEEVQRYLSVKAKEMPPKDRSLETTSTQIMHEISDLVHERDRLSTEKSALDAGSQMWRTAVYEVTAFEKQLRDEMIQMGQERSNRSPWEDDETLTTTATADTAATPEDQRKQRMRGLLEHLNIVIGSLQEKFDTAEGTKWSLLIAAIGAELHALKEGRKIIEGSLGIRRVEGDEGEDGKTKEKEEKLVDTSTGHGLEQDPFEGEELRHVDGDDDDNDDTDPELMFSRQGIDE